MPLDMRILLQDNSMHIIIFCFKNDYVCKYDCKSCEILLTYAISYFYCCCYCCRCHCRCRCRCCCCCIDTCSNYYPFQPTWQCGLPVALRIWLTILMPYRTHLVLCQLHWRRQQVVPANWRTCQLNIWVVSFTENNSTCCWLEPLGSERTVHILQMTYSNAFSENMCVLSRIPISFVLIDSDSSFVQVIDWRLFGTKSLPEPTMTQISDACI